ncbi:hypothetical protein [uncultured Roseobacter sp.]|uniref:hypothetical protein n=1 Tax=uncultured Roseobacter sp. TaxID=114847 RepID=UPI00261F1D03|nr:hypothetical protein [uncultured Roseobacter sp.]
MTADADEKPTIDHMMAAYLFSERGKTQVEIADLMGISQSKASRLLSKAKELNVYREERVFNIKKSPELEEMIHSLLHNSDAVSQLRQYQAAFHADGVDANCYLRSVEIVHANRPDKRASVEFDKDQHYKYTKEFSQRAGEFLGHSMQDERVFGLSWGAVVYFSCETFVKAIENVDGMTRFVAAAPTITSGRNAFSAGAICGIANIQLGTVNDVSNFRSFAVPAFIQRAYRNTPYPGASGETERAKFVRLSLEGSKHYVATLGGYTDRDPTTAASVFGTFITGLGRFEDPYGKNLDDFLSAINSEGSEDPVGEADIRRFYVGDFAGALLIKSDLSEDDRKRAEEYRDLWTGIRVEDMREITRRAGTENAHGGVSHGVVAIGAGRDRALVLLAALEQGVVSKLLVDEPLYDELMSQASKRLHKRAVDLAAKEKR